MRMAARSSRSSGEDHSWRQVRGVVSTIGEKELPFAPLRPIRPVGPRLDVLDRLTSPRSLAACHTVFFGMASRSRASETCTTYEDCGDRQDCYKGVCYCFPTYTLGDFPVCDVDVVRV